MASADSRPHRRRFAAISRGTLFASFLKMGLLGFGGVLPWARRVIVDERRWLDDREFAELIGLCQVLPGPNVVNLSVIIGARSHGPVGSLIAVTGILFVPVGVMLVIAIFYASVAHEPLAQNAIAGASAAAAGLITRHGVAAAAADASAAARAPDGRAPHSSPSACCSGRCCG